MHVYADGLNRFYATAERAEQLKPAFALPPNVFDDVQLSKHSFMCRELCQELQEQRVELAARYESAQLQMRRQIEQADVRHQAMLNSLSWRITAPLRKALHLLEQADVRHQAMLNSLSWCITTPLRKVLHLLSFAARKREAAVRPHLSPGTREWLAKMDVIEEKRHS